MNIEIEIDVLVRSALFLRLIVIVALVFETDLRKSIYHFQTSE